MTQTDGLLQKSSGTSIYMQSDVEVPPRETDEAEPSPQPHPLIHTAAEPVRGTPASPVVRSQTPSKGRKCLMEVYFTGHCGRARGAVGCLIASPARVWGGAGKSVPWERREVEMEKKRGLSERKLTPLFLSFCASWKG